MNPNTIGRKFLENSETIRHTTGAFSAIAQRDYVTVKQPTLPVKTWLSNVD